MMAIIREVYPTNSEVYWVNTLQEAKDKVEEVLAAFTDNRSSYVTLNSWDELTREEQLNCQLPLRRQILVVIAWGGEQVFKAGMAIVHVGALVLLREVRVHTQIHDSDHAILNTGVLLMNNPALVDFVSETAPIDHYAEKLHGLWMSWAKNLMEDKDIFKHYEDIWTPMLVSYDDLLENVKQDRRREARILLELE